MVSFPLENDPSVSLIAWTTTPWTLPSNLALCVNPTLIYVKVKDLNDKIFILMEARLEIMYKKKEDYTILDTFPGEKLKGLKYKPLFPYFIQVTFLFTFFKLHILLMYYYFFLTESKYCI